MMLPTTLIIALAACVSFCMGIAVASTWHRHRLGGHSAELADRLAVRLADGQRAELTASARLDARLAALCTDLGRITGLMRQLENGRSEQYGHLSRHLEHTMRTTAELASTTRELHRLLSSNAARGQWGERMADDILRTAGLVEGVNYVRQQRLDSGGIPDVTVFLPQGRRLHMDVKFPIAAYVRYLQATDETAAARHRAAFLRDARDRVREVATRDYLDGGDGIGLALLLIPNEAVFAFIQQHAPEMFDEAMSHGVAVCSPLTLFAVLAVVRHTVDSVHLAEASAEIRVRLGAVERAWQGFVRDLERLGTHLRHARGAYDDLAGSRRRELDTAVEAAAHVGPGRSAQGDAA